MDNLGKAYGQLPAVSTRFRSSTSGAVASHCVFSLFLERKKRDILFRSIGSPLSPQRHIIIERGVMYQLSIWENYLDFHPQTHYYRKGRNVSIKYLGKTTQHNVSIDISRKALEVICHALGRVAGRHKSRI